MLPLLQGEAKKNEKVPQIKKATKECIKKLNVEWYSPRGLKICEHFFKDVEEENAENSTLNLSSRFVIGGIAWSQYFGVNTLDHLWWALERLYFQPEMDSYEWSCGYGASYGS
ncbi:hypothetical protein JHK87_019171 [Glycine soja]|nr:hypothetical protein JHK87_019171 [Glycine soja]